MNNPATELVIDGATLEGGGQVLRCCLSLAWLQQAPVRIHSIRAGRPKPGLANQHLAGARLSATLAGIQLEGDSKGSTMLVASPAAPAAGAGPSTLVADAQTAGAATLILQAVLPPLLMRTTAATQVRVSIVSVAIVGIGTLTRTSRPPRRWAVVRIVVYYVYSHL